MQYELPKGWTWQRVREERSRWDVPPHFLPIASAGGAVAWGAVARTEPSVCGHSVCSQYYIDTGSRECVQPREVRISAADMVRGLIGLGSVRVISHRDNT